jgi:CRP-like cAMP-binding protein
MAPRRTSRSAPPAGMPVRNSVLAALLTTEYKRLLPRLEHVTLKRGAMVDATEDGRTVEVGIIGREGIVGINIFLGGAVTPDKAIVQLPGGAMRMKSSALRKEVRFGSPLQRLLLGYTRTFLAVISQSVACSEHHNIGQRLARWLLTMSDYAGSREFLMTQESIAAMLGVRRVSSSDTAAKLQAADLISYRRGRINVLDRPGLEQKSCECYQFIRRQYRTLHGELPRMLSRK